MRAWAQIEKVILHGDVIERERSLRMNNSRQDAKIAKEEK